MVSSDLERRVSNEWLTPTDGSASPLRPFDEKSGLSYKNSRQRRRYNRLYIVVKLTEHDMELGATGAGAVAFASFSAVFGAETSSSS